MATRSHTPGSFPSKTISQESSLAFSSRRSGLSHPMATRPQSTSGLGGKLSNQPQAQYQNLFANGCPAPSSPVHSYTKDTQHRGFFIGNIIRKRDQIRMDWGAAPKLQMRSRIVRILLPLINELNRPVPVVRIYALPYLQRVNRWNKSRLLSLRSGTRAGPAKVWNNTLPSRNSVRFRPLPRLQGVLVTTSLSSTLGLERSLRTTTFPFSAKTIPFIYSSILIKPNPSLRRHPHLRSPHEYEMPSQKPGKQRYWRHLAVRLIFLSGFRISAFPFALR